MNKEILNDIWLFIAQHPNCFINDIPVTTDREKAVHLLLEKKLVLVDKTGKLSVPKKYNKEQYYNVIILNLNVNFVESFITIDSDIKMEVIKEILNKVDEKEVKKEEIEKNKLKKIENLKNQNWLLILNDLKKLKKTYVEDGEMQELILDLTKEFELKFKSYFSK